MKFSQLRPDLHTQKGSRPQDWPISIGVTHFLLPGGPTQILVRKHLRQPLRRETVSMTEEDERVMRVRTSRTMAGALVKLWDDMTSEKSNKLGEC